jgi:DNA primase
MELFDTERYGMVFVPNDDYLALYCGDAIRNPELGCYDFDGNCIWNNNLIVPIFNVAGKIAGLGGFNPLNYVQAHETGDWSILYYQYSSKQIFKKGSYLYCPLDSYEKALTDGYIVVVDGLFDAISLREAGFNSAALMGSSLTNENVTLLRFVKHVILAADNDDAGLKLQRELGLRVKNLKLFRQKYQKDVDGLLKSEYREQAIRELRNLANDPN